MKLKEEAKTPTNEEEAYELGFAVGSGLEVSRVLLDSTPEELKHHLLRGLLDRRGQVRIPPRRKHGRVDIKGRSAELMEWVRDCCVKYNYPCRVHPCGPGRWGVSLSVSPKGATSFFTHLYKDSTSYDRVKKAQIEEWLKLPIVPPGQKSKIPKQQLLELKKQGMTYEQVGRAVGLRCASTVWCRLNKTPLGRLPYIGVCRFSHYYRAKVKSNIYIPGKFDTPEEAAYAYDEEILRSGGIRTNQSLGLLPPKPTPAPCA